jgi:hypothetical protein
MTSERRIPVTVTHDELRIELAGGIVLRIIVGRGLGGDNSEPAAVHHLHVLLVERPDTESPVSQQ